MLTDEKFSEAAKKFLLLEDTDHKFFTLDEYKTLVEAEQTDKDGNIVYLYTSDPVGQYNYIKAANDRGYSVLLMDGQLDNHFVSLLEQKQEKTRLVRVDADVLDKLIAKENNRKVELSETQRTMLTQIFSSQTPAVDKANFMVTFEALSPADQPITITQSEYMRRMKDMAALQPGMSFYGEMPDSYNLVVNTSSSLIEQIRDKASREIEAQVKPFEAEIAAKNAEIDRLRAEAKDGKLSTEEQQQTDELQAAVGNAREQQDALLKDYAAKLPEVRQLIDLALLGNGLLKGKDLSDFIARSVEMIKM